MTTEHDLKLPTEIAQPVDLFRLEREIDRLDNSLNQEELRAQVSANETLSPKMSIKLAKLTKQLDLDIKKAEDRRQLKDYLERVKEQAPTIHISFPSEPSNKFLLDITSWLRKEVNPLALIVVGLDPTIGVGSIVRTTNHYFNFSLANRLQKNDKLLSEQISQLMSTEDVAHE